MNRVKYKKSIREKQQMADSYEITLFYQQLLFYLYSKKNERDSDKDRNDTNRFFHLSPI